MGEFTPKGEPGQRPSDYQQVLDGFKRSGSHSDRLVRLELLDMAEGQDPQGIRSEMYKGWKDEDFKALLADLGYQIDWSAQ